jgi:hypothetical protein
MHIRIAMTMCAGVVIPLSVRLSTSSSTSWYIIHTIHAYLLRSSNVNSTTFISTQQSIYPLSHHHMHRNIIIMAPGDPPRCATSASNWTKHIYASLLKEATQDMDAVSSQSALSESLKAVQEWKTQHDRSTTPWYSNMKLYTLVRCVANTGDPICKPNSDI